MLSWKINPNDAKRNQENQTKQCIILPEKSYQTMHNALKRIKPNDA